MYKNVLLLKEFSTYCNTVAVVLKFEIYERISSFHEFMVSVFITVIEQAILVRRFYRFHILL